MGLQITVTHLTRMSGDRICVAGLTDDAEFVRPDCDGSLRRSDVPALVQLGARVDLGRVRRSGSAPQTENVDFDRDQAQLLTVHATDDIENLLAASAVDSLEAAFGTELLRTERGAHYILPGTGTSSLATVAVEPGDLNLYTSFDKARGSWTDARAGACDRVATDLRLYPQQGGRADGGRVRALLEASRNCETIYLSVGLSKRYAPPDMPAGHWVQLNNVLCV